MKPWQTVLAVGMILNGLSSAALYFADLTYLIKSLVAGALLPVVISSTLLFWVGSLRLKQHDTLQKINLAGFFIKIILVGIWVSILILSQQVEKVTFIVSLTINFLVWHGVEAYYWPLFWSRSERNTGE